MELLKKLRRAHEACQTWLLLAVAVMMHTAPSDGAIVQLCSNSTAGGDTIRGAAQILIRDDGSNRYRAATCSCKITALPEPKGEFNMYASVELAQASAPLIVKTGGRTLELIGGQGNRLEAAMTAEVSFTKTSSADTPVSAILSFTADSSEDMLKVECQTNGWIADDALFNLVSPRGIGGISDTDTPIMIVLAVIIGVLLILTIVFMLSCCRFRRLSKELEALREGHSNPTKMAAPPGMPNSADAKVASWVAVSNASSPNYQQSFDPPPDVFGPPAPPDASSIPRTPATDVPPMVPDRPAETLVTVPTSNNGIATKDSPGQRLLSSSKTGRGSSGAKDEEHYYAALEGTYIPLS